MFIHILNAHSFNQLGQRSNQEDARWPDSPSATDSQRFFLVCDGVGGNARGEVASQTVCMAFAKALAKTSFDGDFTNGQFAEALHQAYLALDKRADDDNRGMATTLTFICFHGTGCTMAHIGDSRIYQIRPSEGIIYRSDDHSLVNSLVHNGVVSPEEGIDHPQQHVITRYMEAVDSEHYRHQATVMRTDNIQAGDFFLLCTDGVLHCVTDDDLLELLNDSSSTTADKMAALARRCTDSTDNNTAWLIAIDRIDDTPSQPTDRPLCCNSVAAPPSQATKRMTYPRKGTSDIDPQPSSKKSSWIKRIFS